MTEPTATIVHKLPKQIVPDDYLKLVIAANKTGFGFAGQENGSRIVVENTKAILINEVNELQNLFKDNHLVMYFTNGGDLDDVQPYTVTNGQADKNLVHQCAMFYVGDYSKYTGLDGTHSGAYCVYDAEIAAKISSLFVANGKDWTKTFDAMRDDKWQRILNNYFANHGAYVILPPSGDPIAFGHNDLGGQFPWGNVSERHGYTGKALAAEPEEDNGGLGFLRGKINKIMSSAASVVPTPQVTPPAAPQPEPVTPAVPAAEPPSEGHPGTQVTRKAGEDIETKVVDGVTYTKMRPPSAIRGHKKANNQWLRTFNHGKLDEETQRNQFCWVPADLLPLAQRNLKSKDEVDKLANEIHKLKKPPAMKSERVAEESRNHLVGTSKPITSSTVRETPAVSAANNAAAKSSVPDYLPILSDADRIKAMEMMAAFTSKGKRLTGLEIQKMEATWPIFSQDIGVTFEEMMERPVEELKKLLGNDIAACAFIEMRAEVNRLRTLAQAAKLDITRPTKVEEKTTVPPAKKPDDNKVEDGGLDFLRGRGKSAA